MKGQMSYSNLFGYLLLFIIYLVVAVPIITTLVESQIIALPLLAPTYTMFPLLNLVLRLLVIAMGAGIIISLINTSSPPPQYGGR